MQDDDRQQIEIRRGLVVAELEAAVTIVDKANQAEGLDLPVAFGEDVERDVVLPQPYGATRVAVPALRVFSLETSLKC
jgi:hypothetical protein